MKLSFGFVFFFIALLGIQVGNLHAQHWTELTLPDTYNEVTPYFLNENIGFVFNVDVSIDNGIVLPHLLRTTDGGMSWKVLPSFDNKNESIQQLYFTDINRGYAATSDGVYETKDTGNTWGQISKSLPVSSVYAFGNKVFAFIGSGGSHMSAYTLNWGPLLMTSNDGISWDTIITPKGYSENDYTFHLMMPYIFGNKDSIIYAEDIDASNNMFLVYSTNNGKDWANNKVDNPKILTMGLFSFPHCKDILRTFVPPLDPKYSDDYFIVLSSDFGIHWDTLLIPLDSTKKVTETGAWFAGNDCMQYISNARDSRSGEFRCNRGQNWVHILDPSFIELDDQDFHNLSVVGGGAVVYAGDYTPSYPQRVVGRLWKTIDGGDGTLTSTTFASTISTNHTLDAGATICDTSFLGIFYQNLSCNYSLLKNFAIDGLDPQEYSSEWHHHPACDGFPDTVLIKIFPSYSTRGSLTLHEHFINDEFQTIDTSFTFAFPIFPGHVEQLYLKPSSLSYRAGDTLEIPIYINSTQSPSQPDQTWITLTYSLNTNLLTPFAFIPTSGVTADPVQTTKTTATVTLHFDPGFTFSGETELGRLRCVAYVTDTLETDITLTGAAHSSGCLTTLADSNVAHFTLTDCGTTTISNFLRTGKIPEFNIHPNPATNSIQVQLSNTPGTFNYELFDALGISRKNGVASDNSFQIDVSDLAAGNYYLRLKGENNIPATKEVVIVK